MSGVRGKAASKLDQQKLTELLAQLGAEGVSKLIGKGVQTIGKWSVVQGVRVSENSAAIVEAAWMLTFHPELLLPLTPTNLMRRVYAHYGDAREFQKEAERRGLKPSSRWPAAFYDPSARMTQVVMSDWLAWASALGIDYPKPEPKPVATREVVPTASLTVLMERIDQLERKLSYLTTVSEDTLTRVKAVTE
jgi:hypothetical protein